ncbi:MAG TPA: IS21 family transposase [Alphaproteobacteria bacterium]|nr:IS21 family transposase [Alphaproteobacteria bacterium]HQS94831.1 IS21 family transposase [Alphaproteobacteria bacterium]
MNTTILTLWKQGKSKKEIAEITGRDRKTVRKIIARCNEKGEDFPSIVKRESKLDEYNKEIISFLESDLSIVRISEKLKDLGCPIGYSGVKRYVRKIKINSTICVRFHSQPGEEAQVDFGYVGLMPDPQNSKRRKSWVFNMRLSYSRFDYYEVVFDQKVETFIRCHENAFRFFGGIPGVVKIDNLKAGILEAHFYESIYQRLYKEFSDYYGFYILPCRVRQPQEKGKVEAGIKYIKNNFFAGRQFETYKDLCCQLREWIDTYCHERVHGTTKEKPRILFETKEREFLKSLPIKAFYIGFRGERIVHKDCHIVTDNNFYSVPFKYVGQKVEVETNAKEIKIFYENHQVALHARQTGKGGFATQIAHYPKYKYYTPDSVEYLSAYKEKMNSLGKETEDLFSLIVKEHPQDWYRIVKGILNLRKKYSDDVINLTCQRAMVFGITNYQKIKKICESGFYQLPISNREEKTSWKL